MNRRRIKMLACGLISTAIIVSLNIPTSATGVAAIMPVAGFALLLEEGTTVNKIKEELEEKKENKTSEINGGKRLETVVDIQTVSLEHPTNQEDDIVESSIEEEGAEQSSEAESQTETNEDTETNEETETNEDQDKKEDITVSGNKVINDNKSKMQMEKEEEKELSKKVIAQVNDYVNVRDIPSEEGEIVGKLYDESVGEFISEKDGWYEITSGNTTGFVKAEYVVTGKEAIALAKEVGKRNARVQTETLFVRENPSTDATVLGMVPMEDELTVLEELDGWVKVSIQEGEGYVSAEFVELFTDFVTAESTEEENARKEKEENDRQEARSAASNAIASQSSDKQGTVNKPIIQSDGSMGSAVASYGSQFVGNKYVYGGTSLTNGADCSGFVKSVYANFGVSLPRTSASQRSAGTDVGGIGNAIPGDIVAYSGHVGIYVGNGQMVHASTAKTGIIISNVDYRPILSVRRIF